MTTADSRGASRLERAGAAALAAEGLAAAAWAVATALSWATGGAEDAWMAAFVLAFAIAVSTALAWASRGLWRGKRWPRGLATLWQVVEMAIALGSTGGRWWLATLLLVPVPIVLAGVAAGVRRSERMGD